MRQPKPSCVFMFLVAAGAASQASFGASGVSPYLPLNMSPEIERQIEQVLILADKSIMSRPIAAATVLDALPAACEVDAGLCRRVRRYLERYSQGMGIGEVTAEAAASSGSSVPLPNARGMESDSAWKVAANVYWQPSAYALVSLGGVAYDGDQVPSGSMLSMGFEYAQLDIGYRDHWLSPFTTNAMLLSTQAPTMPSITLSNYEPISPLNFRYEIFLAEMSHSDRIRFQNELTEGEPRLAGLHFSIEPVAGWSLAGNRIMQFGGGARGGRSFSDFLNALWDPGGFDARTDVTLDEEFGNQAAAWTSRFIFPGRVPFSAYLQYAGEDRAWEGNYRFGNASLSLGIDFPRLWERFDLTYEVSEWQNSWYTHGIFLDGLTNEGHVLGHWGADQRQFGHRVGAQTHAFRFGWEAPNGDSLSLQARTIANEKLPARTGVEYERSYDLTLRYSTSWQGFTAGAEIMAGNDVFGDSYGRLSGYVSFADEWRGGSADFTPRARPEGAELFLDVGLNSSRVRYISDEFAPRETSDEEFAPHLALGARRAVSRRNDLGVRVEVDRVQDYYLIGVRALDYRFRLTPSIAVSAFAGAARYDRGMPAFGYYGGLGLQWRNLLPGIDLSVDGKYADKVARDKLLPSDPPSAPRNDVFYDISTITLYATYKW